jgi:hypothetical protein
VRPLVLSIVLLSALAAPSRAQSVTLKPELAGIGFLVGSWGSGTGTVAETGGTSRGSSTIAPEANGSALLRRDHTDLFDRTGKPSGSFDQIMLIYPEAGTLHADYADGDHVIHYTSATVVPGTSVVFTTGTSPGAPAFRLSYVKSDSDTLAVTFEIAPPGQTTFHSIATGTLRKNG